MKAMTKRKSKLDNAIDGLTSPNVRAPPIRRKEYASMASSGDDAPHHHLTKNYWKRSTARTAGNCATCVMNGRAARIPT